MESFILQRPLPYAMRLETREVNEIDLLVLHCTELPGLGDARRYGENVIYPDSGTGNSGHFYIDRDGRVEQWVSTTRIAHHVRSYNERSIGIELVNSGRYPDWYHTGHQRMGEPYTTAQIDALNSLIGHLERTCPALKFITGHEELDRQEIPSSDEPGVLIRRKMDPGPLFPWNDVLAVTLLVYARQEDL